MGRLDDRIRRLEERDARDGFEAALRMASSEAIQLLAAYCECVVAADGACAARPNPTPEEEAAWERLEGLRRRAVREGWDAAPWRAC